MSYVFFTKKVVNFVINSGELYKMRDLTSTIDAIHENCSDK